MLLGQKEAAKEQDVLRSALAGVFTEATLEGILATSRVRDIQDGGMGSIRFIRPEPQAFGKAIAEAQYIDSDGVPVSIAVNIDRQGDLFEMDFWKVDFSPLKRYPNPEDLSLKH